MKLFNYVLSTGQKSIPRDRGTNMCTIYKKKKSYNYKSQIFNKFINKKIKKYALCFFNKLFNSFLLTNLIG